MSKRSREEAAGRAHAVASKPADISTGSALEAREERRYFPPAIPLRGVTNDLHKAVLRLNDELVVSLLDSGAIDPNARDENGETIAHLAVRRADPGMMSLLLNRSKIDWLACNLAGQTPLHLAADLNALQCVHTIISAMPKISLKALRLRETGMPKEMDEAILKYDRLLNSRDISGQSALHVAAAKGHPEIAALLVGTPIDLSIRDNAGKTAYDIAHARIDPSAAHDEEVEIDVAAIEAMEVGGTFNRSKTYNVIRRAFAYAGLDDPDPSPSLAGGAASMPDPMGHGVRGGRA